MAEPDLFADLDDLMFTEDQVYDTPQEILDLSTVNIDYDVGQFVADFLEGNKTQALEFKADTIEVGSHAQKIKAMYSHVDELCDYTLESQLYGCGTQQKALLHTVLNLAISTVDDQQKVDKREKVLLFGAEATLPASVSTDLLIAELEAMKSALLDHKDPFTKQRTLPIAHRADPRHTACYYDSQSGVRIVPTNFQIRNSVHTDAITTQKRTINIEWSEEEGAKDVSWALMGAESVVHHEEQFVFIEYVNTYRSGATAHVTACCDIDCIAAVCDCDAKHTPDMYTFLGKAPLTQVAERSTQVAAIIDGLKKKGAITCKEGGFAQTIGFFTACLKLSSYQINATKDGTAGAEVARAVAALQANNFVSKMGDKELDELQERLDNGQNPLGADRLSKAELQSAIFAKRLSILNTRHCVYCDRLVVNPLNHQKTSEHQEAVLRTRSAVNALKKLEHAKNSRQYKTITTAQIQMQQFCGLTSDELNGLFEEVSAEAAALPQQVEEFPEDDIVLFFSQLTDAVETEKPMPGLQHDASDQLTRSSDSPAEANDPAPVRIRVDNIYTYTPEAYEQAISEYDTSYRQQAQLKKLEQEHGITDAAKAKENQRNARRIGYASDIPYGKKKEKQKKKTKRLALIGTTNTVCDMQDCLAPGEKTYILPTCKKKHHMPCAAADATHRHCMSSDYNPYN